MFGFGALRLNSEVFRPRDSDEPVRIYHDDHVVYETNKAWNFGIAKWYDVFLAPTFPRGPFTTGSKQYRARSSSGA